MAIIGVRGMFPLRILSLTVLLLIGCCVPVMANEVLSIQAIERRPFSFQTVQGWDGFSIELLELIAERRNWTLNYRESADFVELLGAIKTGTSDIAAGNISVTFAREMEMDFSQPIFDSGLIVLAPAGGHAGVFSVLFSPALLMWVGGAILVLFAAGAMIARVEGTLGNDGTDNDYDDGKIGGIGEGIWWSVNVVTQTGFDISSPKTRAGRFLAFGLMLTGLFAVSAFVAQITAALTVNELNSQVNGYQDLVGKRIGTTLGSTSAEFLERHSMPYETFATVDALLEALEHGELDAVIHDAPVLAHYAAHEARGHFELVGRVFQSEQYAFALVQGQGLTEDLNRTLLQIREDGSYAQLVQKWFGTEY